MNKKGFTMIELIVTIGIIALIGIVVVNNMTGFLSKQEDENYNAFLKKLEDAACIFIEIADLEKDGIDKAKCRNENGCVITVDQLIKRGYIEDNLRNPNNDELITENKEKYKVNVHWENSVKTCDVNGK